MGNPTKVAIWVGAGCAVALLIWKVVDAVRSSSAD